MVNIIIQSNGTRYQRTNGHDNIKQTDYDDIRL